MEHIGWLIALVWAIFAIYTWMVADVVHAVVAYLRILKIRTQYETAMLHNELAEYSEQVKKEHPEAVGTPPDPLHMPPDPPQAP
jgi:hypothetical protein